MPDTIRPIMADVQDGLTDNDVHFISDFIYQRSGILLGESKRYLIESRLKSVARVAGIGSISNLCRELSKHSPQLETLVLDALTTNETSWFRDKMPYEALGKVIFPALHKNKKNKILQIWSAASSSGQEPYSIAMLVLESGLFHDWQVRIVGTDISTRMLGQAQEGLYSQLEVSRGLPTRLLIKYFSQQGEMWKLKPEVREMVTFKEHVLQNDPTPLGIFDVVFCRNVLIYFDIETKQRILGHIHHVMTSEGLLSLGGSETTLNISNSFEPVKLGNAVYYCKKNSHSSWHNIETP